MTASGKRKRALSSDGDPSDERAERLRVERLQAEKDELRSKLKSSIVRSAVLGLEGDTSLPDSVKDKGKQLQDYRLQVRRFQLPIILLKTQMGMNMMEKAQVWVKGQKANVEDQRVHARLHPIGQRAALFDEVV